MPKSLICGRFPKKVRHNRQCQYLTDITAKLTLQSKMSQPKREGVHLLVHNKKGRANSSQADPSNKEISFNILALFHVQTNKHLSVCRHRSITVNATFTFLKNDITIHTTCLQFL